MTWKLSIDEEVQGTVMIFSNKETMIKEISSQVEDDLVEISIKKRAPRECENGKKDSRGE